MKKKRFENYFQKTAIKCLDPAEAERAPTHEAMEQPLTDPRKPRGACKNLRKHKEYRTHFKKHKNIIINCLLSCSNGKGIVLFCQIYFKLRKKYVKFCHI